MHISDDLLQTLNFSDFKKFKGMSLAKSFEFLKSE